MPPVGGGIYVTSYRIRTHPKGVCYAYATPNPKGLGVNVYVFSFSCRFGRSPFGFTPGSSMHPSGATPNPKGLGVYALMRTRVRIYAYTCG